MAVEFSNNKIPLTNATQEADGLNPAATGSQTLAAPGTLFDDSKNVPVINNTGLFNPDSSKDVQTLTAEQSALNNSIAGLRSNKDTDNEKVAAIDGQISEYTGQIDAFTSANITLQSANDKLNGENETLNAENTSLQTKNDGLTNENTGLQAENDSLEAQNTGLEAENSGLQGILSGIAGKIAQVQNAISSAINSVTESEDGAQSGGENNAAALQSELASLNAKKQETENSIKENEDEISKNDSEIESNEGEIAENDSEIAANDSEIAANEGEISENDSEIAANEGEIAENDEQIVVAEEARGEAEETKTGIQDEIENLNQGINDGETKSEEYTQAIEEAKEKQPVNNPEDAISAPIAEVPTAPMAPAITPEAQAAVPETTPALPAFENQTDAQTNDNHNNKEHSAEILQVVNDYQDMGVEIDAPTLMSAPANSLDAIVESAITQNVMKTAGTGKIIGNLKGFTSKKDAEDNASAIKDFQAEYASLEGYYRANDIKDLEVDSYLDINGKMYTDLSQGTVYNTNDITNAENEAVSLLSSLKTKVASGTNDNLSFDTRFEDSKNKADSSITKTEAAIGENEDIEECRVEFLTFTKNYRNTKNDGEKEQIIADMSKLSARAQEIERNPESNFFTDERLLVAL